jgi:hypothetical protein
MGDDVERRMPSETVKQESASVRGAYESNIHKEKQAMKTSMSVKRLVSLFAALALVVVVLLTVQARITASNVVSSPQSAVDQAVARDPHYNPSSAAAPAEQPRLDYSRGDSNVVSSPQAAMDQAGSSSSQPYYRSVVPSLSWQMAPTSDYAPVGRSAVPTPGWQMAPTSDYVPVGLPFHTPPISPDRHR